MNIIQIGSNRGYDDLTRILEPVQDRSIIKKLILVEPLSVHHDSLRKCYTGFPFIIEQLAISDKESSGNISFFYHVDDGPGYEVASLKKEHILKFSKYNEDGIREEIVPCATVNQLMAKHGLKEVDVLTIDAEGLDDKIVRSIHFEDFNVINLIYEHIHINRKELAEFLRDKGYNVQSRYGTNGWCSLATKKGYDHHPSNRLLNIRYKNHKNAIRRFWGWAKSWFEE